MSAGSVPSVGRVEEPAAPAPTGVIAAATERGDDVVPAVRGCGSDRSGEFVERGSDPEVVVERIDAEFVVAASRVLHKRVTSDHHARRAVALQPPRIGRRRAFNRPWSHSTQLFARTLVSCSASGSTSCTAPINALALSVVTCSGQACSPKTRWKNRRGDAPSRRAETRMSITWPCSATVRRMVQLGDEADHRVAMMGTEYLPYSCF